MPNVNEYPDYTPEQFDVDMDSIRRYAAVNDMATMMATQTTIITKLRMAVMRREAMILNLQERLNHSTAPLSVKYRPSMN